MMTLEDAKHRLPIRDLMVRLKVPAESIPQRDGQLVRCPWPQNHQRGDQNGSFNTYQSGTCFKCFSCNERGDGPRFMQLWLGLSNGEACRLFSQWAGMQTRRPATAPEKPRCLRLPQLHRGNTSELNAVCRSRRVSVAAVKLAQTLNLVRFGTVCGFAPWILTDPAKLIAEARRIDGLHYPAYKKLGERKAHTLAGSCKSWPVGAALLTPENPYRAVMIVEGQPDLLAALEFLVRREVHDLLPIAMLGRQAGAAKIAPDALQQLRNRRIRIYPHADPDGLGLEAARNWTIQLRQHGCEVDAFDFRDLRRIDGKPVNDLNDALLLADCYQTQLEDLLP